MARRTLRTSLANCLDARLVHDRREANLQVLEVLGELVLLVSIWSAATLLLAKRRRLIRERLGARHACSVLAACARREEPARDSAPHSLVPLAHRVLEFGNGLARLALVEHLVAHERVHERGDDRLDVFQHLLEHREADADALFRWLRARDTPGAGDLRGNLRGDGGEIDDQVPPRLLEEVPHVDEPRLRESRSLNAGAVHRPQRALETNQDRVRDQGWKGLKEFDAVVLIQPNERAGIAERGLRVVAGGRHENRHQVVRVPRRRALERGFEVAAGLEVGVVEQRHDLSPNHGVVGVGKFLADVRDDILARSAAARGYWRQELCVEFIESRADFAKPLVTNRSVAKGTERNCVAAEIRVSWKMLSTMIVLQVSAAGPGVMPQHLDRRRFAGDDAFRHARQAHQHRDADGSGFEFVNRLFPHFGAEGSRPDRVQHRCKDEVGQREHVLVVIALDVHLLGPHAQADFDQELLDDGVTLDGNAAHRVGEIDRAEQVE